jgi:radical SAM protein with 4Fe4S-binding SPASM domain
MFFPAAPISFSVELTYACPNRCRGCANVWHENRQESLADWKTLLDRIAPPSHRQKYAELIRITGGEPALHKDFPQIIEYLDSFDVAYAVFTTGRWQSDVVAVCRNRQNLAGLLISLHGSTAETHNAFVQSETAFAETCASIRQAAAAGIEVFTNTVLTRAACHQLEDIIALSQELGASCAVFNRYLGQPDPTMEPEEDVLRKAVASIEQQKRQGAPCRLGNCVPPCFADNSFDGANSGIEHCVVSPNGEVRPDSTMRHVFGNLFEQSIETVWQSEAAQQYRASLPETCLQCVALLSCRGGYRLSSGEERFLPDPLMRQPITETSPCLVTLDPQSRPNPLFNIRHESFGLLLTRSSYSLPVQPQALPLVAAIDGQKTVVQLQKQFGEDALDFIAYLYKNGFVCF